MTFHSLVQSTDPTRFPNLLSKLFLYNIFILFSVVWLSRRLLLFKELKSVCPFLRPTLWHF